MIVVLDTNVVVSSQLSKRGIPARIVRAILSGELTAAFDARILGEYEEVLLRPKFGFDPEEVQALLDQFIASGSETTARPISLDLPDPDDAMFIEVAVAAAVDYLITGNVRHFPKDQRQGIKVVSPSAFWRSFAD
jgi:putative PIN family toxin of toxin-antitoxin system